MAKDTEKRSRLAQAATDYALDNGLIGLSLRPLAAAIGTSDRMLLYHFADKDDLVATVLHTANQRSIELVRALPRARSVRRAVLDLWAAWSSGHLERCQRLYVEAAALGLFGQEPYAGVVRSANETWVQALGEWLVAAGCPPKVAPRAVLLMDAAMMGLHLDLPLDRGSKELTRAVEDLAAAVQAIANP